MTKLPAPRVLVAPLDWGLGHTTRCIPVIRALREEGCEVLFAGEGPAARLIEAEFPGLTILPLTGYRIRYANHWTGLQIAIQIPKICMAIYREHHWLRRTLRKGNIRAVISDNRWGLSQPGVPCVLITHQLNIMTGSGSWADRLISRINYRFIRKFSACWVPDLPDGPGLAGKLSHPDIMPDMVTYLGCLSRLNKLPGPALKKYDLAVLISGPEPQRTLFERRIISQLPVSGKSAVIISGQPDKSFDHMISPAVRHISHLPAARLGQVLQESGLVISRSGYTTIMDLVILGLRAVLIPTPGQPEQEYLADYMKQQGWFYSIRLERLRLDKLDEELAGFPFLTPGTTQADQYRKTIREFVQGLNLTGDQPG